VPSRFTSARLQLRFACESTGCYNCLRSRFNVGYRRAWTSSGRRTVRSHKGGSVTMIGRLMGRRARRKLAVSTVVANLLMIGLTLALAAILVAWAGTSFGSLSSGSQLFFAQRGEALQERLVIENVFFSGNTASNHTIMIFVRNVGEEQISLVAIYVNGTSLSPTGSGGWLCRGSLPVTLVVGAVCEFSVQWGSTWVSGSLFDIIVTTAMGNRATITVEGP